MVVVGAAAAAVVVVAVVAAVAGAIAPWSVLDHHPTALPVWAVASAAALAVFSGHHQEQR